MVTEITKFVTNDGAEFDNRMDAELHEANQRNRAKQDYERFLCTYSGNQLLGKHALTEHNVWEVRGEDPNCDFGGHHHEPFIANVEGTLENVIKWAVVQPNFWTWGGGGSIQPAIKFNVIKV